MAGAEALEGGWNDDLGDFAGNGVGSQDGAPLPAASALAGLPGSAAAREFAHDAVPLLN